VAFLLDPAHGWEMTDYPQWPFGVSQIDRGDRALRELFGVAYYPGTVVEGEPATSDRQVFVSGIFGDIFDVLVASERGSGSLGKDGADVSKTLHAQIPDPLSSYRAVVVGGHIDWSPAWVQKINDYVRNGGTVVINAAQIKGIPEQLLGVHLTNETVEADSARCLSPGEAPQDLSGQMFRYEKTEVKGANVLLAAANGDPLVTVNKIGKGNVIFCTLPDLLGEDERITPFAAHMLAHVFSEATPVRVSGDVEYLINRTESGWVVTLFNNNGVFKPQQGLAHVDRNAYVNATINLGTVKVQSASDWIVDKPLAVQTQNGSQTLKVQIAPGAVAVVELRTKP